MDNDEKVYRLLIEGYCAVQISKKTKLSKGYISRIIKRLESGGYIQPINPNEKPRFYIATKKRFTPIKFTTTIPEKYNRLSHRLNMVEIQKSSFICNVMIPPTKGTWDKEYEWHHGIIVQQYSHPFKNLGEIIFRRLHSKSKDRLMIILPRICVHKSEVFDVEELLNEYAVKACMWIKKRFDMPLSKPVICQKPHYAVSAKEPEMIKAIDEGSFNINGMMADKSPPDFMHEVESEDPRDIVNYLDSIRKIKNIERQLINNSKLIHEILDKMEIMSSNQEQIAGILSMMNQPQTINKPDSFLDVV